MQRFSGYLLIAIGVSHTFLGVWGDHGRLIEIARSGFFNAIEAGQDPERAILYWFLFTGFALILYGHLCLWVEKYIHYPLPAFVGWELLALSTVGAVLDPDSGIWLVMAVAIYVIGRSIRFRALRSGEKD